jgi:alanine racemase
MNHFNRILVDAAALAHNFSYISSRVGPGVRVMAMVKSDAYGHDMHKAAEIFAESGCRNFGVADLDEGVALREGGCRDDIMVFVGFDHRDVDYLLSHRLTPVIFSLEDLKCLASFGRRKGQKMPIYLKVDCGMGRLGFAPAEVGRIMENCRSLAVDVQGVISHYPCSDEPDSGHSLQAYRLLASVEPPGAYSTESAVPFSYSICNSGGILYFPQTHGDMVRAGISLYGYYPDGKAGRARDRLAGLKPAMSCHTRVVQVKQVAAGSGISYGHTYICERDTSLAVLPIGYSDGYFRLMSNRAEVLIKGQRAPLRGRICMNMCMADITAIEGVTPGEDVVLLGHQGDACIDADEIGGWSDTISYEVLCSLGNNNKRFIIEQL